MRRDEIIRARWIVAFSIIGVLLLGGIIFSVQSCTHINAGHVGVSVKKCGGGGVDDNPIPTGYHWRNPFCEDVIEYPTSLQTIILADGDSDKSNDGITVNSIEGLPITVDVSLSLTLEAAKVPAIYKKYRSGIERIISSFIRQTIREALQIQFAKWTAEEIYAQKKEIIRGEAQKFLTDRLTIEGFVLSQFTLNDVRVPKQVTDAINAKVAMTQEAQKAEAEVRKTEAIAKQTRAAATGNADALRLRADAEAYYNQTVAKSLTPEFVLYQAQQKWNGQLPQFNGGGVVPFVQLNPK
jgi:regulator of protease activity HflC (stomatin/prohibitin superfamily)